MFQDLKRYLTSPPVRVAPRPIEPMVLYLAATPHSASAALVAVREERQAKSPPHNAHLQPGRCGTKDDAMVALTAPANGQALQDGVPGPAEALMDDQAPEAPLPQEAPQPPEALGFADAPALVEHPVFFVSTVLRDARARYPMP